MVRLLAALLVSAAGAQAAELDRPITLPQGKIDLTLNGTYANWGNGLFGETQALDGETLALGADVGATGTVQVGLALVLPVHPRASFGSVLVTSIIQMDGRVALRLDAGYDRAGVNGGGDIKSEHTNRWLGGLGVVVKVPIAQGIALVTGQDHAAGFNAFTNIGDAATGFYFGIAGPTQPSTDLIVISGGDGNSETRLGIHPSAGLLAQPDPHLALRLQAGYSAVTTSSGPGGVLHFVPLSIEAIVSPAAAFDAGARFALDGFVAASDQRISPRAGYLDLRTLTIWLRFHV